MPEGFDVTKSTAVNYLNPDTTEFASKFESFRQRLQYDYHTNYTLRFTLRAAAEPFLSGMTHVADQRNFERTFLLLIVCVRIQMG